MQAWGGGAVPVDINKLKLKGMSNYEIYKRGDWFYTKFDGRRRIFRGMTKAEFSAAKDRHFAHQRARYSSLTGQCYALTVVESLKRYVGTPYEKVIIEGNEHLYTASPIYRHADYNKGIFAPNTERNRRKAELINSLLNKSK